MSADMSGQNTEDSARAVIIDTPWSAAFRVLSTSTWSVRITITLSLYVISVCRCDVFAVLVIVTNRLWHLNLRVGDAVGGHFLQCGHIDVAAS